MGISWVKAAVVGWLLGAGGAGAGTISDISPPLQYSANRWYAYATLNAVVGGWDEARTLVEETLPPHNGLVPQLATFPSAAEYDWFVEQVNSNSFTSPTIGYWDIAWIGATNVSGNVYTWIDGSGDIPVASTNWDDGTYFFNGQQPKTNDYGVYWGFRGYNNKWGTKPAGDNSIGHIIVQYVPSTGGTAEVSPASGPYVGGNVVVVTNAVPGIGNGSDITNVTVGGVAATITGQGTNWVRFVAPANNSSGLKPVVVQSTSEGLLRLWAYTVNPAGQIDELTFVTSWTNLGSGMQASVRAMAYDGTNLYAGGSFTSAGGVSANRIAKWNGTTWTNLGSGLNSTVRALLLRGSDLYVAGDFTTAGGGTANNIARWNGTSWSAVGSLPSPASAYYALAHDGVNLYLGGYLNSSGYTVFKWNGSAWSNLGVFNDSSSVQALLHDGTSLYAGGSFTNAGGVNAARIARWNGTTWTNLGSGLNNWVYALAHDGTALYAAGQFTDAGGVGANRIAKWNWTTWTNLGSGLNIVDSALLCRGGKLYAGGSFSTAGGVAARYAAVWNGTLWSAAGITNGSAVLALAHDGTNLYAGGEFGSINGNTSSRYIAKGYPVKILDGGVSPASGSWNGGYSVVIVGHNLGNGTDITNVTLGGVAASTITAQSATQVVVWAGTAMTTGTGDVVVMSTSFGVSISSNAFTYTNSGAPRSTITFDSAGGSAVVPITRDEGEAVVRPADPTRAGYTFDSWSPPVPATMPVDDLTCVAQWDALSTITITFESAYGATVPPAGVYTTLVGSVITNQAASPDTRGMTQYACAGWTATENLSPASGSGTQAVVTVNGSGTLTWQWTTNYWLDTGAGPQGTVNVADGWQNSGVTTQITAGADPYYHFTNWTGDVEAGQENQNPLALVMDGPKAVMAHFAATWTANRPTPHWWLAGHGITEDFETAVDLHHDGDGVPTGDEWIMNTDPTNAQSYLRATSLGSAYGPPCHDEVWTNEVSEVMTQQICTVVGQLLTWSAATGRVYDVEYDVDSPWGNWQPLSGQTNLTSDTGSLVITNAGPFEDFKVFRIKVRIP
jgi:hypothetical protein